MSEARTESTEALPPEASAQAAAAAHAGKHRGPAASEEAMADANGRHRRNEQSQRV
ncbi:hypothetical protein ACWIG3_05245 [Streptomyces celluloflavus]|uniref:Uncharacterized protein n=1 Tax=Streptomyces celluloflavus TaxID=58344 RepID=A0ABW7RNK8_9ACTN|nr:MULTISPECIES: hypothetical protein [Streptomyces]WSK12120.1 hypothetical protein OG717_10205 [Streptomyces celluloflavus]